MKAAYKAEHIGNGYTHSTTSLVDAIPASIRREVTEALGVDLDRGGRARDPLNPRPWVAEITGTHPTYRYERRFLTPKIDYRLASSTGNRGVWFYWTLESGRLYQTSRRTSWTSGVIREFVTVTDDGDIATLTEAQVDEWLNSRLPGGQP